MKIFKSDEEVKAEHQKKLDEQLDARVHDRPVQLICFANPFPFEGEGFNPNEVLQGMLKRNYRAVSVSYYRGVTEFLFERRKSEP